MQINRLFEMVYLLLAKKTITAKDLAERFEVSVRTIYRDVDTLSAAGIPIYASQGKGGGIALLDEYILDKSVLSEKEQNEILFALQSLTVTRNPETDQVLLKLSSLFHKDQVNWIEVDFSSWGSGASQKCQFSALRNAILNRRIIIFEYFNASGEKSIRKVEPRKLVFKVNAWYLQGFCLGKQAYRTFKISRMTDLQITPEIFAVRSPDGAPEDEQVQRSEKRVRVQLRIAPRGAYRVYDEFDEKEIAKNQDGSFTVTATLPETEWLFNYLLSFGDNAEVVAPQNIREKVRKKLEALLEKYQKQS